MLFKGIAVNTKIVEDIFKLEPGAEHILSRIWEINEQVDLQKFATFFRTLLNKHLLDRRTWWESRTGKQMSPKEEALVFGNPKMLAQITALSSLFDYIEGMAKLQNLANLMGQGKYGPVNNNKNCRGARKGGEKRAECMKLEKINLLKIYTDDYIRYKKMFHNLSKSQIYEKIAEKHSKSFSHVYKIVNEYKTSKTK